MLVLLLASLLVGYGMYNMYIQKIPEKQDVQGKVTQRTIFPMGSIDTIALHANKDIYVPTLDTQSIYLHVDKAKQNSGTNGLNSLYNVQQGIQDKMAERAGYLVDVRNRDGRVLPVPFNRKTILMYPSGVGL
jgi:hypothetical protein